MNFFSTMNGQLIPVSSTGFFMIYQGASATTYHYLWECLEKDFEYWNEDWIYVGY
jgi:hypothetical protein